MGRDILITFPHAGGSSMLFNGWKKAINFEMVNVDYPGHWVRTNSPFIDTFEELKEDAINEINRFVSDKDKIVIYGHSMGAIMAWEIACFYMQRGININGLCLSGSNNPNAFSREHKDESIADNQLMEMVDYKIQEHSELDNQQFVNHFLPMIKNDFLVCKSYKSPTYYCDAKTIILYGESDPYTEYEKVLGWKDFSNCVSFIKMTGKHMFINEKNNRKQIIQMINSFCDELN